MMKKKHMAVDKHHLFGTLQSQLQRSTPIRLILKQLSSQVDRIMRQYWPEALSHCSLLAIGGYGRCQLHPFSDVDIVIITPTDAVCDISISTFLQALWDEGLKVSHSVRSFEGCLQDSQTDLHLYTSLLEARDLAGVPQQPALFNTLCASSRWTDSAFLQAKIDELIQRHYQEYDNLEPDIKTYPGGIRDFHHLLWCIKRLYHSDSYRIMYQRRLLTHDEMIELRQAVNWLMTCRFHLHCMAGKAVDHLRFDFQMQLAEQYGFKDTPAQKAVEQFMQCFYRAANTVRVIIRILNQQFVEQFIEQDDSITPIEIGFSVQYNALHIDNPQALTSQPGLLMQAFCLLSQHPHLKGFSVETIRQIRYITSQEQIWQPDQQCREYFLRMLQMSHGVYHQLSRMNDYGVLGLLIPDWQHCVGQMQFDLFHRHTVDLHILEVIRQARQLLLTEMADTLPHASKVCQQLPDYRLLYLAILFHDIGKGTGIDHAIWGAQSVQRFAKQFNLNSQQAELVGWLVTQHLIFSHTAQKADIDDSEIIADFAQQVGSIERLNYLYVLTVVDIRSTNMKLWTTWVTQLLEKLYHHTYHELLGMQEDETDLCRHIPANYLNQWPDSYFDRVDDADIRWQLTPPRRPKAPLIKIRNHPEHGQCELVIRLPNQRYIFASVTNVIDRLNLNIVEARMFISQQNEILLSLVLLEHNNHTLTDAQCQQELQVQLQQVLQQADLPKRAATRPHKPQSIEHFVENQVTCQMLDDNNIEINLTTVDRRGLLADVAQVFATHHLMVTHLKVMTSGEIVEDRFVVLASEPSKVNLDRLQSDLLSALSLV